MAHPLLLRNIGSNVTLHVSVIHCCLHVTSATFHPPPPVGWGLQSSMLLCLCIGHLYRQKKPCKEPFHPSFFTGGTPIAMLFTVLWCGLPFLITICQISSKVGG